MFRCDWIWPAHNYQLASTNTHCITHIVENYTRKYQTYTSLAEAYIHHTRGVCSLLSIIVWTSNSNKYYYKIHEFPILWYHILSYMEPLRMIYWLLIFFDLMVSCPISLSFPHIGREGSRHNFSIVYKTYLLWSYVRTIVDKTAAHVTTSPTCYSKQSWISTSVWKYIWILL